MVFSEINLVYHIYTVDLANAIKVVISAIGRKKIMGSNYMYSYFRLLNPAGNICQENGDGFWSLK